MYKVLFSRHFSCLLYILKNEMSVCVSGCTLPIPPPHSSSRDKCVWLAAGQLNLGNE